MPLARRPSMLALAPLLIPTLRLGRMSTSPLVQAPHFSPISSLASALGGTSTTSGNGDGSTVAVEDEDDIWIWANNLKTKVSAIILLIDGNSNPSQHCQDIITQINTSLADLSSVKVYSQTYLTAIVKLIASFYVNLAIALGKYNASVLAACGSDLWIQLDTALKSLVVTLGLQYSGFAGLCGTAATGLGVGFTLFTKVGLDLCATIFFGTGVHA